MPAALTLAHHSLQDNVCIVCGRALTRTRTRSLAYPHTRTQVENRDGSTEAVISRVEPFAIDKTTVSVDQFRIFAKDTG